MTPTAARTPTVRFPAVALTSFLSPGERRTQAAGALGIGREVVRAAPGEGLRMTVETSSTF
jgi:hypothetical protein